MGLLSFLTELDGSHCAMREGEAMPHLYLEIPRWGALRMMVADGEENSSGSWAVQVFTTSTKIEFGSLLWGIIGWVWNALHGLTWLNICPAGSITLEGVGGIFRRWCPARGSGLLQVSLADYSLTASSSSSYFACDCQHNWPLATIITARSPWFSHRDRLNHELKWIISPLTGCQVFCETAGNMLGFWGKDRQAKIRKWAG